MRSVMDTLEGHIMLDDYDSNSDYYALSIFRGGTVDKSVKEC